MIKTRRISSQLDQIRIYFTAMKYDPIWDILLTVSDKIYGSRNIQSNFKNENKPSN